MREILFRGKRKDNGEWIYGYYCVFNGMIHCIYTGYAETDCGDIYPDYYEVDPDTVGQYTGLTDKNGRKIFEGDIIEGHCHSQWNHELMRCVIAYNRDHFEARHYTNGIHGNYFTYKTVFSKDVVVIGNIYDNPELIGG